MIFTPSPKAQWLLKAGPIAKRLNAESRNDSSGETANKAGGVSDDALPAGGQA